MIEEIKNPLPIIEYFLIPQKSPKIENKDVENDVTKPKANNGLQKYYKERAEKKKKMLEDLSKNMGDVSFINDISMVREFAERQCLDYTLSEAALIAFFEELKAQLLDGKVVYVNKIGKFYVAAPYRNEKGEFKMPDNYKEICPKLKPCCSNRLYDANKEKENKA